MVTGHPDYLTWAGRSAGGGSVTTVSFDFIIPAESLGTYTFDAVPAGFINIYQNLTISEPEDAYIHAVNLQRVSDSWVFFWSSFISHSSFNFPGVGIAAGAEVKISIYNTSSEAVEFIGTLSYVSRSV